MALCYCVVIIDWTVVLARHASNWNLSYWTDYSVPELKHPYYWRWVTTQVAGECTLCSICIHIVHIAVYSWWRKRAFRIQMLSQEVYCASINEINVYFIAVQCPCHVHWKSLKIHVLTSWLGPTNTHGICMNCKRMLICYPEPVWLDQAIWIWVFGRFLRFEGSHQWTVICGA